VGEVLEWLEVTSRETGGLEDLIIGLGTSAPARAALGEGQAAAALLTELEALPGARQNQYYYPALLPAIVRTALWLGEIALAERLVAGLEPRYPHAEHALVATNAALSEAGGDLQAAAEGYADAADRWERFGVVPEQGLALLGQGRCLLGLSRPTEAAPILQHAREIFQRLRAAPALTETDALLQQATALSS
jgi:tetratricopeptide (TPR) repeat protein